MKWFILFVGIVVLCLVVALLLGLAGGGLGRASSSLSHEPLPDEPLTDADFDDLVFDVGARGYRMSQVDGVVDRLRRELREKDEEIAVLRGEPLPGAAAATVGATEAASEAATEDVSEGASERAPERAAEPDPDPDPRPERVTRSTPAAGDHAPVVEDGSPADDGGGTRTPSAPTVGHERTP
ncbi:cell division protein DivIVA [Terrabacter terrigena]|uniref:Cell division protein DivIVA n=1 Tax=Terrabacter terrigena TaxID=574718 RepID=A0ABW3MUH9_9MICO